MEFLHEFSWSFTEKFRGETKWSAQTYAKSHCFLHESSRLRIFVRGVNAKKEFVFLYKSHQQNDLCIDQTQISLGIRPV